jgi:hypothetical protein
MTKLIDEIMIAGPCPISWESMVGDDRVRDCSGCSRKVYNISAMTTREAEHFLEENGASQCIQLFRRPDGTVMTDDCPAALRKVRDRCLSAASFVAGLLASLCCLVIQKAQAGDLPNETCKKPPPSVARSPLLTKDDLRRSSTPALFGALIGGAPVLTKNWRRNTVTKPSLQPLNFGETADKRALEEYQKATDLRESKQLKQSISHYKSALRFIDSQFKADPKFRETVNQALKSANEELLNERQQNQNDANEVSAKESEDNK